MCCHSDYQQPPQFHATIHANQDQERDDHPPNTTVLSWSTEQQWRHIDSPRYTNEQPCSSHVLAMNHSHLSSSATLSPAAADGAIRLYQYCTRGWRHWQRTWPSTSDECHGRWMVSVEFWLPNGVLKAVLNFDCSIKSPESDQQYYGLNTQLGLKVGFPAYSHHISSKASQRS